MKTLLGVSVVVVLAFSAWAAWGRFGYLVRGDPSAKLQAESLAAPGLRTVSLAHMTDFGWEQVVFFGPYTNPDRQLKRLSMPRVSSGVRPTVSDSSSSFKDINVPYGRFDCYRRFRLPKPHRPAGSRAED